MVTEIKNELMNYIGREVTLNYNLGRNKHEQYEVFIKELFDNIFLVEMKDNKDIVKAFSYIDVLTKTIKIKY